MPMMLPCQIVPLELRLRLTQTRLQLITSQLATWLTVLPSMNVGNVPTRRRKPTYHLVQLRRPLPWLQCGAFIYLQIDDDLRHQVLLFCKFAGLSIANSFSPFVRITSFPSSSWKEYTAICYVNVRFRS